LIGGLFNLGIILENNTLTSLLAFRALTGFFLAGIYPVGMKIAADYYQKGLGKSLGFLVGALVIGTAFPHLFKGITSEFPWQLVIIFTSSIAGLGGLIMFLFIPNGPFREQSQKLNFKAWFEVFKNTDFRAAAFGYFGHMWELYAFWAFVPVILKNYLNGHPDANINIPLWSFAIIGLGGVSCIISGYLSNSLDTKKVAFYALLMSGICSLISPLILSINSTLLLLSFLIFWGLVVIADSPLFSTLIAQNAIPKFKGTALTMVNCIGFATTIVSILLINYLSIHWNPKYVYIVLAIGPVLGLYALYDKKTL